MSPTWDQSSLFNSVASVNRLCPLRTFTVFFFFYSSSSSPPPPRHSRPQHVVRRMTWMVPKRNTTFTASFFTSHFGETVVAPAFLDYNALGLPSEDDATLFSPVETQTTMIHNWFFFFFFPRIFAVFLKRYEF